MWKTIKDMMKEVSDTFDPIIEQAHKAHKKALEQKAKYYSPLDQASRNVKKLMSDYDEEQRRIAEAEARRLQEIARKAEEERRLQEAILAEEAGEKEEAAAILEEPVYVPPVQVQKATPKLQGGPVYREVWSARVTDIRALCRAVADGKASPECVMGNMPTLNRMATALKATMQIPGVVAESKRV
ncbi:MAG: hypothetical protein BWX71_02589 [Deltaproteobacteria bacterium ADurb.Bin072]|nr:MAG: hypothetical protein BWX71_02589 [Deltaproteobacteria bacterium ADurb.Bin072]